MDLSSLVMLVIFASPGGLGLLMWDHMESPRERDIVRSIAIAIAGSLIVYWLMSIPSWGLGAIGLEHHSLEFDLRYVINYHDDRTPSIDLNSALERRNLLAFIVANSLGTLSAYCLSKYKLIDKLSGKSPGVDPAAWVKFGQGVEGQNRYAIVQTTDKQRILGVLVALPTRLESVDVIVIQDPSFSNDEDEWVKADTQTIAIPAAFIAHIQLIDPTPPSPPGDVEHAEQPLQDHPPDGAHHEGVLHEHQGRSEADGGAQTSAASQKVVADPTQWRAEVD